MAEGKIEALRWAFDSFERGEFEAVTALMADDVVTHRPEPDGATWHGKEGFFAAAADWSEGFSEWKVKPIEFIEVGEDGVVVRVLQSAMVGGSNIPVESEFWFAYGFRGDKVAQVGYYTSRDEAVAAVGS